MAFDVALKAPISGHLFSASLTCCGGWKGAESVFSRRRIRVALGGREKTETECLSVFVRQKAEPARICVAGVDILLRIPTVDNLPQGHCGQRKAYQDTGWEVSVTWRAAGTSRENALTSLSQLPFLQQTVVGCI